MNACMDRVTRLLGEGGEVERVLRRRTGGGCNGVISSPVMVMGY